MLVCATFSTSCDFSACCRHCPQDDSEGNSDAETLTLGPPREGDADGHAASELAAGENAAPESTTAAESATEAEQAAKNAATGKQSNGTESGPMQLGCGGTGANRRQTMKRPAAATIDAQSKQPDGVGAANAPSAAKDEGKPTEIAPEAAAAGGMDAAGTAAADAPALAPAKRKVPNAKAPTDAKPRQEIPPEAAVAGSGMDAPAPAKRRRGCPAGVGTPTAAKDVGKVKPAGKAKPKVRRLPRLPKKPPVQDGDDRAQATKPKCQLEWESASQWLVVHVTCCCSVVGRTQLSNGLSWPGRTRTGHASSRDGMHACVRPHLSKS